MAKALALTAEVLKVAQPTPKAATPARSPAPVAKAAPKAKTEQEPKAIQVPLQVRLPKEEVRAIKVAAAERDMTISDFMLACFHAYKKT
jgi:NRPS condensation-like uncharacterized protein